MHQEEYITGICDLREKIDTYRPFSAEQLRNLQSWFRVGFTMHSNALEGNSFTMEEVRVLLEDGITIGGKTIREMRETENLARLTDTIW